MSTTLPDGCLRGDDLADAAVVALEALGWRRGMALLDQLLRNDPHVPADTPAALRELTASIQTLPPWADPERLDRGARAYYAAGFFWLNMALGPGALLRTYRNSRGAMVLIYTGDLVSATYRRVVETSYWVCQATRLGGWAPGSQGLRATLGVRLLHARVRHHALRSSDWDVERLGLPVNQYDMAHVGLAFSRTSIDALQALGADFNARELDDIYHLWRCLSAQLGLEPGFQVDTHEQAGALRAQIEADFGPTSREGQALTNAMIDVVAGYIQGQANLETVLARNVTYALIRIFHGPEVADALGVPPTALTALRPLIASARTLRHRLDRLIDGRAGATQRALAEQYALMEKRFPTPPAFVPQSPS